ncbi:hypothetical protein EEJ52_03940 [Staphylococcus pseudintermedius]|nr:hypothetical protein [Staphylococcus pseudintermedius]
MVRKIQFGIHLVYTSIKPNLVEGPAPRKAKPLWQSKAKFVGRGQVQQKYFINSMKNFNVPSPKIKEMPYKRNKVSRVPFNRNKQL